MIRMLSYISLACLTGCDFSGSQAADASTTNSGTLSQPGTSVSGYTDLGNFGHGSYSGYYSENDQSSLPTITLSCTPSGTAHFRFSNTGTEYSSYQIVKGDGSNTVFKEISQTGKILSQEISISCPESGSLNLLLVGASDAIKLQANTFDNLASITIIVNDLKNVNYAIFDRTSSQNACAAFSDPLAPYRQAQVETSDFKCIASGASAMKLTYLVGSSGNSSLVSFNTTKYSQHNDYLQADIFNDFELSFKYSLEEIPAILTDAEQRAKTASANAKASADRVCSNDLRTLDLYDQYIDEATTVEEIDYWSALWDDLMDQYEYIDYPAYVTAYTNDAALLARYALLKNYAIIPYQFSNYTDKHRSDFYNFANVTSIQIEDGMSHVDNPYIQHIIGIGTTDLKWDIGRTLPIAFFANTVGAAKIRCQASVCNLFEGVSLVSSQLSSLTPHSLSNYPTTRLASHEGFHAATSISADQDVSDAGRLMYRQFVDKSTANSYVKMTPSEWTQLRNARIVK